MSQKSLATTTKNVADHRITQKVWNRILADIANGELIKDTLKKHKVDYQTYRIVQSTDPERQHQIATARAEFALKHWDEDTIQAILDDLANGERVRDTILRHAPATVDDPVVSWYRMLRVNPLLQNDFKEARMVAVDLMADDLLDIADDASNDMLAGKYGQQANTAAVRRAEAKINTRQWLMSKLYNDQFGNNKKVEMDVNVNFAEQINKAKHRSETMRKGDGDVVDGEFEEVSDGG